MPQAYEPPESILQHQIYISHGSRLPDFQEALEAGQLYPLAAPDLKLSHATAACIAAEQTANCFGVARELEFIVGEKQSNGKIQFYSCGENWSYALSCSAHPHPTPAPAPAPFSPRAL